MGERVLWLACIFALLLRSNLVSGLSDLEEVTDKELDKLVEQEQYVIVLFWEDKHEALSQDLEAELSGVREDMVDSINAWVVKAINSPLKARYTPIGEPVIVFFRKRIPVIYDGPVDEEEMMETFLQWREPCTQDLTDISFEHLTQSSTGSTTGDWLVHFYREDCEKCDKISTIIETVACKHKGRINVAKVNRATSGAVTGRRFGVTEVPALIFLRLGKMYRYTMEDYDVDSLSSFITGWYKNSPTESIPLPKTPFDDLVQSCADFIRDNPLLCLAVVVIPILVLAAFYFLLLPEEEDIRKPKKKKKKEKKES